MSKSLIKGWKIRSQVDEWKVFQFFWPVEKLINFNQWKIINYLKVYKQNLK